MRFKSTISVLVLIGAAPFHASADSVPSASATRMPGQFQAIDAQSLFDDSDRPMQFATLSEREMKETEGAWGLWGAAAGGLGAGLGYSYNVYINQSPWSWGNFGVLVGLGTTAGAFTGPSDAVWAFNSAVAQGISTAVITRNGW